MSSEDLLTKFEDLVKRLTEQCNSFIEEERAKMKAEEEAYKAEPQRMAGFQVNDDDLVNLNVGGQRLTTTRSTLCQIEGSLLARMFSGRWEDRLKRDKDGAVFFDFNPQYFRLVLDYLDAKQNSSADHPAAFPNVPEDQLKTFTNLVEYLGLRDEILPNFEVLSSEKFNLHSTNIDLQEAGRLAVRKETFGHGYVLGENVYNQGIAKLKLKLEYFNDNRWMFVGMVEDDVVTSVLENNSSCTWPGSYGWTLGSDGGKVWKAGVWTAENNLTGLCRQGDTVKLVLDCYAGKLSLHLPTGHKFLIEIPKSDSWRLNVTLSAQKDKIRIIQS